MSSFDFVNLGWPEIRNEARRAEHYTFGDPRASTFGARRALEVTVEWLCKADATLTRPYKDDLSSLLFEPTFKALVGSAIHTKMNLIRKQGNRAVHGATPVQDSDSLSVVRELFHVLIWLATTGMDRSAATDALSAFAADVNLTGIQHAFVDLVIDQLTTRGSVSIELLYEAPFTDYAPMGPDGLFVEAQVTQLVSALDRVAATATAEAS